MSTSFGRFESLSPPRRRAAPAVVLDILGVGAMLWMLYETLGIAHIVGFQGLSNDDAEEKAASDMADSFWDPLGFLLTTLILVVSIVIHLIARSFARPGRSTTTRVSMIISIAFYVLSFFKITMVVHLFLSQAGILWTTMQNGPDTRAPSPQELRVEKSRLVEYHDTAVTRVTAVLTNATQEHWQSATVTVAVRAADGTVCVDDDLSEDWLAPGERRNVVTSYLDPTDSDPSCVPESVTVSGAVVDVDSRKEIDSVDYTRSATEPVFTSLSPVEKSEAYSGEVDVSVTGVLAPRSMKLLDEDRSMPGGFEIADAQGRRLAWCFEPDEVAQDGSFTTGEYDYGVRGVDPGVFVKAIAVPSCP